MNQGMKHDALLSIGEISRRSGVAVSALHYYESQGLLTSERSAGNQRRYRRNALRRIAVIRVAQSLGVGLAEIANELSQLPEQRTPNKADWARLSSHWRASLDRRIADLQALRDKLDGCIGCGCLSLRACALYNSDDTLSQHGPGARRLSTAAADRSRTGKSGPSG
jgi:MerR family transcriptional regulator, redox-sensitive transcriptional activator SoxR